MPEETNEKENNAWDSHATPESSLVQTIVVYSWIMDKNQGPPTHKM